MRLAEVAIDAEIVIIDDAEANVRILERLLGDAGVQRIRGFTSPRQALAYCRESSPSLVLLDLHMPELDGFAFMAALQDEAVPDSRLIPIMILTADVTHDTKELAVDSGALDFLAKPFDRVDVLLRVANLLEIRALRGRLAEREDR